MRWWLIVGALVAAHVVVPAYVHWLRHRPHRLGQGTQHILLAGLLAQVVLVGIAVALCLLR